MSIPGGGVPDVSAPGGYITAPAVYKSQLISSTSSVSTSYLKAIYNQMNTINSNVWPTIREFDEADQLAKATEQKTEPMFEKILRLYYAAMLGDVRSPLVHLVGPPGCGKSESVQAVADLLGVNLHIINVSRMSPLEIEGVQMPVDNNTRLHMLPATWWAQLKEGDIVLFDEFLRGFPEVYNGLLDILTSRRAGAFHLPNVFFIAASNSMTAPDAAVADRLLHVPVVDARKHKIERKHIAKLLVDKTGLLPAMADNWLMDDLLRAEVLPTYELLDVMKGTANVSASRTKGHSVRNLIGQVRLRQIESAELRDLLDGNNREAIKENKLQYLVLYSGKGIDPKLMDQMRELLPNEKLTDLQRKNIELNIQIVEMQAALESLQDDDDTKENNDDDPFR